MTPVDEAVKPSETSAGSLPRAAEILRVVAQAGRHGIALADIATKTNVPRPTVHRVCLALQALNWLERDGRQYFLGIEMAALGLTAQMRHPLEHVAQPLLAPLSVEIQQTVYLHMRSGNDAVCIARCEGSEAIRTLVLEVGSRQPLGVGAGSMALLAALPEAEIAAIIRANLARYRLYGDFDQPSLLAGIEAAQARGHAVHDGLFIARVSGIGVAMRDPSGHPFGAISMAFVSDWLDDEQRATCARRMSEVAQELSGKLYGAL